MLAGNSSTITVHGAVTSSLADQHFMLFLQLVTAQVTSLPLGFRTGFGLELWHEWSTKLEKTVGRASAVCCDKSINTVASLMNVATC